MKKYKIIKLRQFGTFFFIFILALISYTAGISFNNEAFSSGSSSALPVSKGGTGGSTPVSARANLGMNTTTTITSSSTDNDFPSAKSVYTFGTGTTAETGTFETSYFNFYYEKYPNKLTKLSIISDTIKTNIPAGKVKITDLPATLKAEISKGKNPSSIITFCNDQCAETLISPLYIECSTTATSCNSLYLNLSQSITPGTTDYRYPMNQSIIYNSI
jgi:hypothetical protein